MLGFVFSSKLDWGSHIISIAKTASKAIVAFICFINSFHDDFLSWWLLCISINLPCMEYCCYVWAGAPVCYLELLDKSQKRTFRTVGRSLAVPLAYCRNGASLSLFCRHYFGRCSSELAQLVPRLYSWGGSTRYSDRLRGFFVTIPRCHKDVYVNSFFLRTARPWNFLPIEWFPLTYDLNGFKSRINRHLLTVVSLKTNFLYALIFLCFFFRGVPTSICHFFPLPTCPSICHAPYLRTHTSSNHNFR